MSTITEHSQMTQRQNRHLPTPPAEARQRAQRPQGHPRRLTRPQDVMTLVLRQLHSANTS